MINNPPRAVAVAVSSSSSGGIVNHTVPAERWKKFRRRVRDLVWLGWFSLVLWRRCLLKVFAGHLAYFRVCTATRRARPKPQHATAVQHQHHHLQPRRSRQSLSSTAVWTLGYTPDHSYRTSISSILTPALSSEHPPPARHLDSLRRQPSAASTDYRLEA